MRQAYACVRCYSNSSTVPLFQPAVLKRPLGLGEHYNLYEVAESRGSLWHRLVRSFSKEQNRAKREELIAKIQESYFKDFHDYRQHGGKMWVAPPRIFKPEKSLFLPCIKGISLASNVRTTDDILRTKQATLVNIFSSRLAAEHARLFTDPYFEQFGNDSRIGRLDINYQPKLINFLISRLFSNNLRRTVPDAYHNAFLNVHTQFPVIFLDNMGILNRFTSYTYLVDSARRIRWAACGSPCPEELDALINGTTLLLKM